MPLLASQCDFNYDFMDELPNVLMYVMKHVVKFTSDLMSRQQADARSLPSTSPQSFAAATMPSDERPTGIYFAETIQEAKETYRTGETPLLK